MPKKTRTTTTPKKKLYELVEERAPRFTRGLDPLDTILLEEERELSREAKRMRLEEIVVRKRKAIEKMRQSSETDMGSLPSNADFLNMAKLMADLSPEEAQRVRSSYTFFKMAEKGGSGGMALLPMLLSYAKENPGSSENQMLQYLTLMNSQFAKGLEIARVNPKQDGSLELFKVFSTLITDSVKKPIEDLAKNMQPQQSAFEQILMNPDLFSRAKEIGMFGGSGGTTGEFDLKIEQLRGERELSGRKMDLEFKKMMLERDAKERRTDTIMQMMAPLSALFAGPVDERMREMGRKAGNPHQTPNPPMPYQTTQQPTPQQTILQITCDSCGHKEEKTIMGAVPDKIQCPGCEAELLVNPPSGGAK